MCGITGYVDYQKSITETDLLNASAALHHRGGNGKGYVIDKKDNYTVGLANERLATIDKSNKSAQPFTSSCGDYTITFNGTIYNYLDIRLSLINHGIVFNTLSDTEVLLECYKKWGRELFSKIDGAFAFAILDRKLKQLFLARDTMGVKPLYYYADQNFFAFASEIKGLLKFPIQKKINKSALQKYLRHGYFIGEETLIENVVSFKKKNYIVIDLNSGNRLENEFENVERNVIIDVPKREDDIISSLNELITKSVLRRNVADVNVGVLLSGGYDSSLVAAIIQKNSTKKLKTFTLGFKDKKFDKAPNARAIASYLHTSHHEYYLDDKGAQEMLEAMPEIFDQPIGDSGAIPLAFILKEIAKENTKVVLGAEGGDELFAGYTSYKRAIWLNRNLPKVPNIAKNILFTFAKKRGHQLKELFESRDLLNTFEVVCSFFSYIEVDKILAEGVETQAIVKVEGHSLKSILNYDQDNYLSNDLLLRSDRIAMHFGIDNRDALLNTDLVNFVNQLDDSLHLKDNSSKYLLKKVAHRHVPKELLAGPKRSFDIPLTKWLQTIYRPYVEEFLSSDALNRHNLFNIIEIFKLKNDFYKNGNLHNAKKIWLLLQFQMWYKQHIA